MTNQEAIEIIRDIDKAYRTFTEAEIQALEMAINALIAIEDIKAEIKDFVGVSIADVDVISKNDVLEIIDKHIGKEWE